MLYVRKVFNTCLCLQTLLLVSLDYAYRGHYLSDVKLFWSCFVCYIFVLIRVITKFSVCFCHLKLQF